MAGPLRHFSELEAYRDAFRLTLSIFELSKAFPVEERYSLTAQLRRAVRSVGANIAKAWGKRMTPRSFVAKLSDAEAELHETEHWLACAYKHGYIDRVTFQKLRGDVALVLERLCALMAKPGAFTGRKRASRLARPTVER
jgi:four helix bundle protein